MRGDEFLDFVAKRPPFSKIHPRLAAFFKDYLSNEKVIRFHDRFVLNTHFPAYPSPAFDNFVENFSQIGEVRTRQLFSVTLAVTNRCDYHCWHCYNAGRSENDMSLSALQKVVAELQELGVVRVTLSGGEPLLRKDLESIVGAFDERTSLTLNTTGSGLTAERARTLKQHGLFGVGVSLDSMSPEEHDRLRGKKGAFQTSLRALPLAADNGLYPYIVTVATQELLRPSSFRSFMQFASDIGALEVHLLEPSATGKLAGKTEVLLSEADSKIILRYQKGVAQDDSLPILSTFAYLESPDAFGCGAGITHLYIDGSGEVCPCNLVPLSFGNITHEPLPEILSRMGCFFQKPRPKCVGHILSEHIDSDRWPTSPQASNVICEKYLPSSHSVPRFFQIRSEAQGEIGREELKSAYNQIHEYYDEFWLKEAAEPIVDLLERLSLSGDADVFEAGCGTGFASVLIAEQLKEPASIMAVDLSEGMLAEAEERARSRGIGNIKFVVGDALETLSDEGPFDIIFSSWVLGYIPLSAFFTLASHTLSQEGKLAFVVHKENSPREPLEIFQRFVARDPSVLQKKVAFDFPRDIDHVTQELVSAGLELKQIWEGNIVFRYDSAEEVLQHLLKSGAGTAFYEAIDPHRRKTLESQFMEQLATPRGLSKKYEVIHDYVSCIATKP